MRNISKALFNDPDFVRFNYGWVLWILIVLLLAIGLYFLNRLNQKKKLRTFASSGLIQNLFPRLSSSRSILRFSVWSLALCFLIIGSANLQFGDKKQEVKQAGIDLIICLDVSKSMMAEDVKPYRLKRAKLAIKKIMDNLGSDRVGIVVFAGGAYLQLPLTNDHSAAKMYLDYINTDLVPIQGTNIASALQLATESFPEGSPTNKAIVVISDGEEHDGKAIEIAKDAQDNNIKIYAIGLGNTKGSPIPEYKNGKKRGVQKDKNGSTIITRLNEQTLKQIAHAGDGKYFHGTTSSLGLNDLLNDIGQIEKTEYDSKEFTSYDSKYQFFIFIGILLLFIESLIIKQKGKWFNN